MLKFLSFTLIGVDLTLLVMIIRLILAQPKALHVAGLNNRFRIATLLIIVLGPIFSIASLLSPKEIMPLLVSCAVALNYYFFLKNYYAYVRTTDTASGLPLPSDQPMTHNKFLIKMHKYFSPTRDARKHFAAAASSPVGANPAAATGTNSAADIRTSTSRIDNDLTTMNVSVDPDIDADASATLPHDVTDDVTRNLIDDDDDDDGSEEDNDEDDDDDRRMTRDEYGFMRRRLPPMVVCLRVCLLVVLSSALPAFFFGAGGVIEAHLPVALKDGALLKIDSFLLGWLLPKGQLALWLDTNSVLGPTSVLGAIITDLLTIVYVSYYLWSYIIMIIYIWRAISRERKQSLKSEAHAWDTAEAYMACWIFSFVITFTVNIICPAKSPRIYIKDDYVNPLTGFGLRKLIGGIIHQDDSYGSFPSGHVGETLAVALAAHYIGLTPRFSRFCLGITFLVGVATVWLRYHYFVDVLAGVAVAYTALFLSGISPVVSTHTKRHSQNTAGNGGESGRKEEEEELSVDNDDDENKNGGNELKTINIISISSSSSSSSVSSTNSQVSPSGVGNGSSSISV